MTLALVPLVEPRLVAASLGADAVPGMPLRRAATLLASEFAARMLVLQGWKALWRAWDNSEEESRASFTARGGD